MRATTLQKILLLPSITTSRRITPGFAQPSIPNFLQLRCQNLHISVHKTPNEESRVFTPDGIPIPPMLIPAQPLWFPNPKSSEGVSPLAEKLFQVDGVAKIMINKISLTITKNPNTPWTSVQPAIILAFNKCLSNGTRFRVMEEGEIKKYRSHEDGDEHVDETAYDFVEKSEAEDDENADDLESCIKEVIAKRVAPMVQEDGGMIQLKKFDLETGIVWIELFGACDGCPSSTSTVKGHVETVLKYFFEEVAEVRLWKDVEEELEEQE